MKYIYKYIQEQQFWIKFLIIFIQLKVNLKIGVQILLFVIDFGIIQRINFPIIYYYGPKIYIIMLYTSIIMIFYCYS
jgi:hypothetical protein